MAAEDQVDNGEYWGEVWCNDNGCDWRVRRREYYSDTGTETVATGSSKNLDQAKKDVKAERERIRYTRGWTRLSIPFGEVEG